MTDEEKLIALHNYVENMAPVFFAAVLESPEREGFKNGYGLAMYEAQRDLLRILND